MYNKLMLGILCNSTAARAVTRFRDFTKSREASRENSLHLEYRSQLPAPYAEGLDARGDSGRSETQKSGNALGA